MGIGTAVGIGAGALSSGLAAHSANKAASTQANAATNAAQLQKQSADEALAFQKQQYADQQKLQAPWIQSGTDALSKLDTFAPFQAPGSDFTQDPGYQFRVAQGMKAIQNSAAARGGVLSGGTLKGLTDYSQGAASDEYQNVYNRRMNEYNNSYNQLASRAGMGQTATNTLGTEAGVTGTNVANSLFNSGNQQAQGVNNAAAARASGYAASGNILSSGLNSGVNNYLTYSQLRKMNPPAMQSSGNPWQVDPNDPWSNLQL